MLKNAGIIHLLSKLSVYQGLRRGLRGGSESQDKSPDEERNRAVRPGSEASCCGALPSRYGADWRRIVGLGRGCL